MSGERISVAVPNLVNGISQQAQAFRLPSQGDLQINAMSSILDGISKRPPTEQIAKIISGIPGDVFIHTINRDRDEKYNVLIYNGTLRVFDLLGVEIPVSFPNGKAYLNTMEPSQALRMTTVADYTFVVNREMEVTMDATEEKEEERNQAIAFVKKGIINTTYKIMVDDQWFSYTTPNPSTTVTSTTSSETEGVAINAEGWTWSECYNWLISNNQEIPRGLDPHQWTDLERGYWYYRKNGMEITYVGTDIFITPILDMSDWEHEWYLAYGSSLEKTLSADAMAINTSIRNHVYNRSVALIEMGIITSVSSTLSSGSQPSTDDIAEKLAENMKARLTGFLISRIGSSLLVRRADNADFKFAVSDSWGNEAMIGIKREVQKFQDLPARAWDGFRVRVVGENPTRDDDYYLEYSSDDFYKNGVWKETRGWNQLNRLDAATMPHILVRKEDGTFEFKRATWSERKCGDDHSVPWPSFVEGKIEDVVFCRNRLGFLVDENVVLSGSSAFFNFWPDTATTVLATDPIDIAVTNDKVSLLRFGSVFGESLILFADQAQFQLGSGGQPYLAPDTVRVDKTTEYECSNRCKPVNAGQVLYFITDQGDFSGMREYTVSTDTVSADAPEVTSHVPKYLPKGMFKMTVAVNDGILFGISSETPNALYVYRFFWVGEEKMQSSWSHWLLPEGSKILSISTIESTLFLVVQYADGVYLERIELNALGEETTLGFKVMLDRKAKVRGVYDSATDRTTWTLPYQDPNNEIVIMAGPGSTEAPPGWVFHDRERVSSTQYRAEGNHAGADVFVGFNYEMRYRFSQQFIRESKDPGAAVVQAGRLTLRNFILVYKDSGYFKTLVTALGRQTIVKEHTGTMGSLYLKMNKPVMESGLFRFLVMSRADRVNIEISNPSPFPCCIQAAEWEATYDADARRV